MFGFATDLKAKGQIDHVDFKVFNAPSQVIEVSQDWDLADVPAGLYELPGSFGVFTDDGPSRTLQVDFVGSLGGQEILKREAVLSPVAGKTLFMRMTLVGECDDAIGDALPGRAELRRGRVPRAATSITDAAALPRRAWKARSSATRARSSSCRRRAWRWRRPGACAANQFCQEGTCYDNPPGATQAIGTTDWTTTPTDVTTTVHDVFTTPEGDVFGVGEHGVILHAPPGGDHGRRRDVRSAARAVGPVGHERARSVGGRRRRRRAASHARRAGRRTRALPSAARLSAVWGIGGELWAVGRKADGTATHRASLGDGRPGAPTRSATSTDELSATVGLERERRVDRRRRLHDPALGRQTPGGKGRRRPTARRRICSPSAAAGAATSTSSGAAACVAHLGTDGALAMQSSPQPYDLYAVWASGPQRHLRRR